MIGDLPMDKIIKIAIKTTKPGSKVKPIDKILMFLKDQQKAMAEKQEQLKQKAISEIINE